MAGILENFDKKYGISKDLHRHFDDTQFQAQFFDNGNDVQLDKQGPNPNEWGLADYPTEMAKGIAEQFAGVGSSTLSGLNVLDPENNLATLADAISAATQAKVGKTKQFTASDVNPLEGGAYWYHPQGLPRDAVGLLGSMAALRLSEPVVSGVAKGAVDYFAPNTSDYLAVQSNLLGNKGSDILSKLPVIGSILSSNLAQNAITQAGWLGKLAKWTGEAMGANKMAELISEGGGAAEEVRKKGGNKADEAEAFAKTVAAELPMLTLTDKLEAYTFFKGIGKEGASKFLSGLAKTGAVQGYEEIMQNRAAKFGTGEGNLTDMVNPLTWDTEDAMAGLAGAFGAAGTQAAIRGLNKAFGGEKEAQGQPASEQPTQEATPNAPAPTENAAEEQNIDTASVTPKGARAFLENAQNDMPAGEEYNAITELLDTGSDDDIIAKATSMGYGKKETPVKQEQPAPQPVEQQVETPVVEQEDWATAQINKAFEAIPAQARTKLVNKDGSINWDKINADKNVQKALANADGVETAIKAIDGDEKARKRMDGWGAKKKAAILHAAQQQMAGQGNNDQQQQDNAVEQPVKQEPVKQVEQPAPKPEVKEVKPAPRGDEQNAQAQNQNNGDQNQNVNPKPQQVEGQQANDQGQGQNSQVEQVKPKSTPVQRFKDALGDYVVDEYGFNNNNTRSYVHKSDDGKDIQRVATIQKTKGGKYSASKNTSDKVAEPKVFDTLEEAEAFIAGKKPSKPTANTAKPEPKKEVKPEPAPESKPPTVAEDDINIDEVNKRIADRIERNRAENAPMGALAAEKQEAEDADKKLNKLRNRPHGSILSNLVNGSSMHKFKDALLQRYYHGWTPADVTIKGLEAVLNGDAVKGLPEAAQKLAKKYIRGMIDRVKEYDKAHPEHAQKIADYQKEQGGLRTDENGIVLLSTTMNTEEAKAQREANDKVLLAKGEEIKQAYIRDTMTADEARAAITALTSKYNKIKNMPPVSKDALKKLANIRSWILSDNKERSKGVKLTDKERAESMLEDAQEEIDKAFKVYGGVGIVDKEAISAYESLRKNIQTAKVVFYSNLESEGLKPLKKYEKVFKDAFDKVNGMIDKAGDKKDYEAFKSMLDKAIERAFNNADDDVMLPSTLKGMLENAYTQYWKELSRFAKWKDSEHFPLSDKAAYEAHKAETMERFKEYEKQYNEAHQEQQEQPPSAEPDADGFVDAGAFVNSQLGENFMEDLFSGIDATREQNNEGTSSAVETPSLADQAIEDDVLEQQIADQVDANDTVFAQIDFVIDTIPNSKEQGAARRFFDKNPKARNLVAERLKKGIVELSKVPYKDKSGKDNSVYYVKVVGSDDYVKVSKAEAIVMSKIGKLEIKETTKDAMNKEKKAKYVTEISEDEDWDYIDTLEVAKTAETLKISKGKGLTKQQVTNIQKEVNKIADLLTIEFPADKGCPFDKSCSTWGEWVRKVALKGAQYKNDTAIDSIYDTDIITLDHKEALAEYFTYLYDKYQDKVEDKSRQKKDLEADMVEQPVVGNDNMESEPVPDQAFIDQLDDVFSNSGMKFKATGREPLDSYNPSLLGQVINLGQMAINNYKAKTSEAWHKFMNNAIQSAKKMSAGLKKFATRLLDSIWEYLSNLPSAVSFDAKNLQKTVQNIVTSMGIAKQAYDGGYNYREIANQLKNSKPKMWETLKDFLPAAFRAIDFYPRKVVESNYGNNGGDSNVDVRAPEQSAQGNSGRGNGNGLEANSGNNGRGNQMGGGQTAQGATNQQNGQRGNASTGGTYVSGSGAATGGTQSNQQSGTQKPNDSASMSGNSNGGRGAGSGQSGSTGNRGKLGKNREKAQTDAERQARDAAGKTLSELQFNKEPFKAADEQGIAKAVPTLLPEQLKDVVAIEKRLFKDNGKGMLVANGTGTGKTMTGLGEIVRFLQKGARKILIVVPSSNIRDNWVDDGAKVGLPSSAFATITTGKVAPDAINIITYKAFSENQNILKESWDLVVMDECQWVSSGAKSDENERTNTAQTLRAISGHERTGFEDYMQSKYRKEYRELKKLGDKLKKSRKALENLVAQFGAFGQPVNQLKANIKSMEDQQKALRRKLDIAEQKERKEYDKRLLARKEDTRVLLLSATPFAYSNSIYYAEGLLFNYDKGSYEDYMVDQFGYERKQDGTVRIQRVMGTSIPMPNHILEAKWHDMLVDSGAMINRRLEIQQDYNRRFVKVYGGIGAEIDKGFEILKDYRKGDLNKILTDRFDYSKMCRVLEAEKASAAVPMIKEYLKQGKKVVIFHDYKSEEPVGHPFKLYQEELAELSQDARDEYERLRKEHPELFLMELNAFKNVDQTLELHFKDRMASINGGIPFSRRTEIVKAFNDDNSGLDIVSVVAEAGKEGISLHDTTGEHPRVLINLGMPTRPTSSIQIEGRIYRLGQKSNAQLRYLYTDTKIEQKAFVDYISARTRTAETLALGDASRNLDGAFAIGYLASKTEKGDFNAANDTVDTGGKLYDTMSKEELETAMKQMYEQLNADGAVDEDMKAKLAERIQELEDERNAKKREEILTEQNEKKLLATIKEAVAGNKVTKVADGVYVVEFVGGARNLWIDLNNSQAAILGQMTEEQKRSMLSAADIKGSGFELQGYYTRELNRNAGAVVDIVRLTEVATTHTLDHEIMHFVHNALLKTLEKQHLEKYFKMLLKKQIGEDAYNKLTEEERLARCEEMEADAYADFCKYDRKPKNMVERIFWKMQKWLAHFAEKFGVETPMGIYIRARSGEMFRRRDNLTSEEIAQRIRDVGIKPTKMAKALYQTAWHGTGAIFDQFDNTFNSSGVGDNVHGWGMYFARDERVSRGYRRVLTRGKSERPKAIERKKITYGGQEIIADYRENYDGKLAWEFEKDGEPAFDSDNSYNPDFFAIKSLSYEDWNYEKAIEALNSMLESAEDRVKMASDPADANNEHIQRMLSAFKKEVRTYNLAIEQLKQMEQSATIEDVDPSDGMLLNVDVPEDEVLLNEYKAIDEQPQVVKDALKQHQTTTEERQAIVNLDDVIRKNKTISAIDKVFRETGQSRFAEILNESAEMAQRYSSWGDTTKEKQQKYLWGQVLSFLPPLFSGRFRRFIRRNGGEVWERRAADALDRFMWDYNAEVVSLGFSEEDFFKNNTIGEENIRDMNNVLKKYMGISDVEELMKGLRDGVYNLDIQTISGGTASLFDAASRERWNGRKIYKKLSEDLGSPKDASLFLLQNGVQGIKYHGRRDDACFVIFDSGNTVKIVERYDLALQNNKDLIERSYKECEDEMRKAFPNGKFTPIDANRWLVELKGGARYEIDIKDRIVVNAAEEAKARKDHGLKGKAGEVAVTGKYQGITEDIVDGVISLSRKSTQGTGYHEVYHAAWDAVLNDKEKAALLKEYEAQAKAEGRNVQEVIADAVMNNTLKRQANDSRILSRVKQRVLDFAYALKALFTRMENVHNVMRKIEQGEVWNRAPNEMQEATGRYTAANKYKENLIALHNLTAENLAKILFGENKGKLISPSLAVMPDTFSYNSYGEITLVGDKNMMNPETGAARVYTGDAWTPTVPQPKIVDGEQVFYNKATKKNIPYTRENIEKYMLEEARQQLKADASKIANEQMLAAVLVERLNTIDDMHKAVQKLTNKDDYSPDNLQQTLKLVKGSTAGNQFLQAILNVLQSKNPKAIDFKGELRKQGVKLSSGNMWLLNAAEQLLDQARNIKFGYLEAKVQRTVDISEFRAAVVPQSLMKSKEVQELERRGVEVFSYKDGSVKQRKEAVGLALEITGEQYPVMFQAAGVKAKTADLNKLSIAEDMEKRGMTRERIFDETGWWRAEDGKWRFEIKDDISNIKVGELISNEDGMMFLDDLYDNEELYRSYPQLRKVVVQLKGLKAGIGGYASKANNLIALSIDDAKEFENDVSVFKGKIIRAIRSNAKGLRGTAKAYLKSKTVSQEIDKAVRQSQSSFSEADYVIALNRVLNIVKELPEHTLDEEVTNEDFVENGIRFYNARFFALEEELRLTLVHEIQHFVQSYENHGRGSGIEGARATAQVREVVRILKTSKYPSVTKAAVLYVRASYLGLDANEFKAIEEEFNDIIANMSKEEFREANRIIEAIGKASDAVFSKESVDYYYDFAGEREARQASAMARTNYMHDLFNAQSLRRYPWQHLDELMTGKVQVDFGELLNAKRVIYDEEMPSGTIKFSVKPVDKIDGKGVPDNLDNVVDNKESLEDVKPHGSVQEALRDAQKLGEKNEVEGGIKVKEPIVDKSRDIGALDTYLHSPSHLAKKNPIFKAFYDIFKKAQSVQEKLRNRWLGQLDGAYKMLKSKEDADAYHNLMVDGELKAKEYSMQELMDMGYTYKDGEEVKLNNVAKAYLHTRQMIRNIWEKVNDAHRGLVYRTEKLSAKKVEELSKKPFIENIMVRVVKIGVDNTDAYQPLAEVKLNDKATYEVKYGQPHVFKDTKNLTQEQLDELKANPYAHVVKEEEYKEVEGLKLFKVEVEQVAPPVGKIAGYLPHIFEQWLILVETEQGSVPVSSGKNVKEAVKIAESLQKDAPNVQFYIVPKMFNPSNVLGEDIAEGSTGGASIVLSAEDFSRLEKSISNTFKMSLAEAREALKPVAKKEGKSRFLGSLLHRKGRVGYNTDIADSLSRYIYMTSRYVALQPAKVKAFSLFERTFHGTLGEDYSRTDQLAHVTKNYILHCNGTPNHLETLLTGWLNMIPFWRNYVSTNFGDRSLMSITGRVNGLLSMSLLGGYNISSAVVGLSQLANVYAQIGSRFLGEGMYAYKRMNLRDKRILAETGILYDIGLDTASGFTKRRKLLGGEGDSGLAKAYKFVAYYGDKGMYFFKKADEATRGIAALGAYYKGIEEGMSHKQAIAYAKKVNRDSNFDYGAADAPAIYQRLSGTGIGDLMLLFQKYPIKQFEFMQQMLPYFGSAKKAEKIRFWGAYFLMAGLAGIPLGDWLDELLAKVLGYKPTTAVKSYLFTEFGDNIGTRTLAYGVLSNLGVDVSRRIGMANLAPQGDSAWETALGPGLNILYRMAQSGSDDWAKTIKAFNPSLGNMAEGIRGYKTNNKNQINYIYGDMEKFFKAAGFRTTGESIASDLQSAVYLDKQQKKDARQKVLMEMVKKRIDGEALTPEDYKALREQGITGAQFQKAVKAAKMTALQRTRAGMTKQQKKDFAGTIVMEDE